MTTWLAICDRCGFERKAHELRKEWTGLRVCRLECFEVRHPQDFVRGVPDRQTVPWSRPDPEPVFLVSPYLREDGQPINREIVGALLREVVT